MVHGDIFVTDIVSKDDQEIAKPPTVQITHTPEREQEPLWSPDGEQLLFSSARAGNFDLFTVTRTNDDLGWTDSFEFTTTALVASPAHEQNAKFSPDGDHIAFVRGKGSLVVATSDGSNEIVLHEHFYPPTFSWSPDGRWIAFSSEDQHANSEIFIVSATGGEPYNVSRHPDFDENPVWSPDGKRLVWGSHRHDNNFDVWAVWLTSADHQRTPAEWLKVWRADDDEPEDEGGATDEDDDEPPRFPKRSSTSTTSGAGRSNSPPSTATSIPWSSVPTASGSSSSAKPRTRPISSAFDSTATISSG